MAIETATGEAPMQDIAARLELALDAEDEARNPGTDAEADDVIEDADLPDDEQLPDDDDADDDEDDQDKDLEDIADEDDEATLADFLGVDEERISVDEETGVVSLVAKVDGEDSLVPLKELVSSYQLQGHVNNKSIALEEERKEFDQTKTQVTSELETRIKGTMALSKALEDELVNEYNSIDWDNLRVSDPANWTALRQEYAEKAQRIQKVQALNEEQLEQTQKQQHQEVMELFQKHIAMNKSKVIEANPDWADDAKFKAGIDEVNSFLKSTYDFTDDELKALNDHRLLKVIQDAQSFRSGKAGAEKKRAKKVPKFLKPGQQRGNRAALAKARKVKAKRQNLKDRGGRVQDVADLIADRM